MFIRGAVNNSPLMLFLLRFWYESYISFIRGIEVCYLFLFSATICNINWDYHSFESLTKNTLIKSSEPSIYFGGRFLTMHFSSVQFSHSVVSDSLQPHESQHARPPCPTPTPGVHSDSHPSSQWCHPAISSSVIPFSSCPQSLPASESFPMSQHFALGGQSTGVSALASFLSKKSQGWSPLEWTGCIPLPSKGPSRVFSNTTVQKHQFFSAQPSS